MRRILGAASIAACLATAAADPAGAAVVVDVNNLIVGTGGGGGFGGDTWYDASKGAVVNRTAYQTWPVGTAGQLAGISMLGAASWQNFAGTPLAHLKIYGGGSASSLGSTLLGALSTSLWDIEFHGVTDFDLSGLGIVAGVGDVLTLEMSVSPCGAVVGCNAGWSNWSNLADGRSTDGYAGGQVFYRDTDGTLKSRPLQDMNFRTLVDAAAAPPPPTSPVPEPSTWALMLVGFGAVGYSLRRRPERRFAQAV